ncbi:MAG: hypothetical protein GTO41_22405, partial [Burkholderiales bacterium]|nr:hypothetical protein [Burkholderiales bacterium]
MKAPSALLYDFLLVPGGAEQMLLRLKQERPEFLAVLGFIDRQTFPATHFPAHEFRALTSPSSIKGWQGIKALLAF